MLLLVVHCAVACCGSGIPNEEQGILDRFFGCGRGDSEGTASHPDEETGEGDMAIDEVGGGAAAADADIHRGRASPDLRSDSPQPGAKRTGEPITALGGALSKKWSRVRGEDEGS
eukprot:m.25172 g.25172  ORF g.25172 m.25172 type:complete len:115 (-) comp6167_c0_seq2:206-550(-)